MMTTEVNDATATLGYMTTLPAMRMTNTARWFVVLCEVLSATLVGLMPSHQVLAVVVALVHLVAAFAVVVASPYLFVVLDVINIAYVPIDLPHLVLPDT
jgi:hypothetical protein